MNLYNLFPLLAGPMSGWKSHFSRAAAMGLSYNLGRGLSAFAPFAVGAIAARFGFLPGFFLLAGAFLTAALLALLLPETRGRELT